ncbi:mitochondrial aspartate-glutamate transporter agc1 [Massospora cicadina]|nr:mitochondrial aspartate-glutamate transporter agc1 [Massospora cicadina]
MAVMAIDAPAANKSALGTPDTELTRADTIKRCSRVFASYATKRQAGESYMTKDDFISALSPDTPTAIRREEYGLLFRVADPHKRGDLSFDDFVTFEELLARSDAEFAVAFKLLGQGKVSIRNFKRALQTHREGELPFDLKTEWFQLYTGGEGLEHAIDYPYLLVRQAFQHFAPEDFKAIVRLLAKNRLPEDVIAHSPTLGEVLPGNRISYASVTAFHNVLRQLDLIVATVEASFKASTITKADFMKATARLGRYALLTPWSRGNPDGRLTRRDFSRLLNPAWGAEPAAPVEPELPSGPFGREALKDAYAFLLGSVAGGVGGAVVYPVDLVKTRMQNQRSALVGPVLYKNSLGCLRRVVHSEGFVGLYRGLGPQLLGVAPEKAIKLTINDLVRGLMADQPSGDIPLWVEWVAGGCAGASQVAFTDPLEIVKIRLQVQGELAKVGPPRPSALWVVRNLGLLGLYRGVGACLLRDVPFSAIYFTTYSHLKRDYFHESGTNKLCVVELLAAGAAAGMPAAYLTTPADVIKTRLQVEARMGETRYLGLYDAAARIYREEGVRAFFKGGTARIFRSSPQFGVTLAAYELLQRTFPLARMEATVPALVSKVAAPTGADGPQLFKSQSTLQLLRNLDYKFGLIPTRTPKG